MNGFLIKKEAIFIRYDLQTWIINPGLKIDHSIGIYLSEASGE
jgi:hypothetical protein